MIFLIDHITSSQNHHDSIDIMCRGINGKKEKSKGKSPNSYNRTRTFQKSHHISIRAPPSVRFLLLLLSTCYSIYPIPYTDRMRDHMRKKRHIKGCVFMVLGVSIAGERADQVMKAWRSLPALYPPENWSGPVPAGYRVPQGAFQGMRSIMEYPWMPVRLSVCFDPGV